MCAAAAAKAAAILLCGGDPGEAVDVRTPAGVDIRIPLAFREGGEGWACCGVVKDGGDDPDATHGLLVLARVSRDLDGSAEAELDGKPDGAGGTHGGVVIKGGKGVGVVTRPGLAVPVGEPAINPGPRTAITEAVRGVLPPGMRVVVEISVPEGERVAGRTFNPKLGIIGGISILGTSGIVEPMSEEAFKRALEPQLGVARAAGYDIVALVPGRRGERAAVERFGFPPLAVVQMSNFVGFMLGAAARAGFKGIILLGHHGKLVKVAAGVFNTHSQVADARLEVIAAHAAAMGAPSAVVREILASNTAEDTLAVLEQNGLLEVMHRLAGRVSQRAMEYLKRYEPAGADMAVGTVLLSLEGHVLGADEAATSLARSLGGRIIGGALRGGMPCGDGPALRDQ